MHHSNKIPEQFDVIVPAPFGPIGIYAQGMHVRIVFLDNMMPTKETPAKIAAQAAQQIQDYLNNAKRDFNLPLVFKGTDYQKRVWSAIAAIPFGETKSYSDIAETLDSCPRAVANACGANHLPIFVPCHRVVGKHDIGGFMRGKPNGVAVKEWLLAHEGAL